MAATDESTRALARYQYRSDEGPGLEALQYGEPRRIDDMAGERRWPGFCATATRWGLRSVLAVPLRMAREGAGALTMYSPQRAAFDGMAHDVALLLAARSAIALGNADLYFACRRLVDNLHEALTTRAVIEQAKGIVMARDRCEADAAFASMRQESQHTHVKLRDVAARMVAGVSAPEA